MSGTVFLLDKETREPVKEDGSVSFKVINDKGGIELDSKYIMGIALNQIIVVTKED